MNRFKHARLNSGLSQKDAAINLDIHQTTISQWETDRAKPSTDLLSRVAELYGVSADYLLGSGVKSEDTTVKMNRNSSHNWLEENGIPVDPSTFIKIPIVGTIRAGVGGIAMQDICGYELVDPSWVCNHPENYFFVKVKGDSMFPKFEDGDLVMIKKQTSVDSGSIAAVIVDGEEGVLKRVIYGPTWIELHSFNPYYPARRFEGSDVQRIFICGRVVKRTTNF